jgi:hypothetical protein
VHGGELEFGRLSEEFSSEVVVLGHEEELVASFVLIRETARDG